MVRLPIQHTIDSMKVNNCIPFDHACQTQFWSFLLFFATLKPSPLTYSAHWRVIVDCIQLQQLDFCMCVVPQTEMHVLKRVADVSTECYSHHQGESKGLLLPPCSLITEVQ